jgi:hypothetical protein
VAHSVVAIEDGRGLVLEEHLDPGGGIDEARADAGGEERKAARTLSLDAGEVRGHERVAHFGSVRGGKPQPLQHLADEIVEASVPYEKSLGHRKPRMLNGSIERSQSATFHKKM